MRWWRWWIALGALISVAQAQELIFSVNHLTPDAALRLARETLDACRTQGFQVTVAVTDRSGLLQVLLRDQYAGPHTIEVASDKAWTAASFRTDTLALTRDTADAARGGQRQFRRFVAVGGGLPVFAKGVLVGAVAVAGGPGGEADHECARSGLSKLQPDLDF